MCVKSDAVRKDEQLIFVERFICVDHIEEIVALKHQSNSTNVSHCACKCESLSICVVVGHRLIRKNSNIGNCSNSVKPRLLCLNLGISCTDKLICSVIHVSVGMHLIAYRAFRTASHAKCFFITECVGMLVSTELAPMGVELTGHAEIFHIEIASISRGQGEMVVSPTACRKRLKLKMSIHVSKVTSSASYMTAVVEHRKSGLVLVNSLANTASVICIISLTQLADICFIVRVLALSKKCVYAVLAITGANADDIKEDSVAIVFLYHFLDLCDKVVEIRTVHAELVITGLFPVDSVVLLSDKPLGMTARHFFVKTC